MLKTCKTLCIGSLLCLLAGQAFAQDWANWRGPNYNGSTTATNLPVKFSPKEGVKWATPLPGPGASTPIIWKNYVFLTSTDTAAQDLVAICLERHTGKVVWKQSIGTGYLPGGEGNKIQLDSRSNYSSPSPVTDGKHVIFFFGNGDLAGFDMKGNRLWQRNLQKENGEFCFNWTFSSSPQLWQGRLYMQILQRDQVVGNRGKDKSESYLMALDPSTGKEMWRASRPSEAHNESRESYATPIPFVHNGRKELLIAGGDCITGHDPETGKELWRWGTWNPEHREVWWRLVPSPVAGAGVVLSCAPKTAPVYATKAGATGDISVGGLVWRSEDRSAVTSDVPTPLFYEGKFYVLSDVRRAISCVDPQTGKPIWSTKTPGTIMFWGSPTGADGKIYLINLHGEVLVVDAKSGEILATNPMAEEQTEIKSTIAVAYNSLFIRTNTHLYCVTK